ncbi:MAG: PfkB domain protein [Actinomycetia bacterium]|nr:PfkB domain protein [Actinomycetes bacterium]
MSDPTLDVVAIGNAIVDVLAPADDALVEKLGLSKGAMNLVDADESARIYAALGPAVEQSGGSAANTCAGIASFGGTAGFVGRVRDDQLGEVFAHDLRSIGVQFETRAATSGAATARSMILITPDAHRTMCTFLGAAAELEPDDVPSELIRAGAVTYLEGYLWDQPLAKDAIRHSAAIAHAAGRRVAFTLSDSFCVERHRDEFLALIDREVDVLFANEAEITALYETDDFDAAVAAVQPHCEITALTRSELGAVVTGPGGVYVIPAEPVSHLVDTTGAGDQFAAGFLYGLTHGLEAEDCGRLGALAAAEVIEHVGPRPETSLRKLASPILD